MSKKKTAQENIRYEVMTHEDPKTGDMLIPLPPQLLTELGWKEGDNIDFQIDENGKVIIKKI
jgi:hypothetical protein